jgi:hypothetical protein
MNPRNYIFNSPSLLFTGTIGQNTSVNEDNDLINEKYKIKNNTMNMKKMCDM